MILMTRCFSMATLVALTFVAIGSQAVSAQQIVYPPGTIIDGQMNGATVVVPQQTNTTQMAEEDKEKVSLGATLFDTGNGISVQTTYTNGPAFNADLRSGDMLTMVNGEAIENAAAFEAMVAGMSAGDSITVTRKRQDDEAEATITLMTMGEVMKASLVPEPGLQEQAVMQSQQRIDSLKQRIKNAELDMADMKKQLADMEAEQEKLKETAKEAKAAAEKQKADAEAKMKADKAKAEEAAMKAKKETEQAAANAKMEAEAAKAKAEAASENEVAGEMTAEGSESKPEMETAGSGTKPEMEAAGSGTKPEMEPAGSGSK